MSSLITRPLSRQAWALTKAWLVHGFAAVRRAPRPLDPRDLSPHLRRDLGLHDRIGRGSRFD